MQISIAERLHPFCHLPGTSTVLPGCGYQVQVFPCLIRIYHLKNASPTLVTQLSLELRGPVQQFTVCNDLEKGRLTVSGLTSEGWMRYHLISSQRQEGIRLVVERAPANKLRINQEHTHHVVYPKEWLDIIGESSLFAPYQVPICMRLSLGNHKAQDGELMKRRLDLAEILPIWHRLGQLVPIFPLPESNVGTLQLLEVCRQSFSAEKPEEAQQNWLNLIQAGFSSLWVPRLKDDDYQGFIEKELVIQPHHSPLVLLSEGARLISRLFFQQEKNKIAILPYLLPCLPFGRLLHVPLEGGGLLNLEWTKKTIRRLNCYVTQDQEVLFKFRSDVRSYRLRQHTKDKGEVKNCQDPLFLKKNCHYFFDNFK